MFACFFRDFLLSLSVCLCVMLVLCVSGFFKLKKVCHIVLKYYYCAVFIVINLSGSKYLEYLEQKYNQLKNVMS